MPDIRLHIEDSGGDGRPVVLIHGWPLSAESWDEQTDALVAAGYRVVSYDRRGFGRSEQPETGYDYDTLAADLDSVLTDLDLDDVTLVGFSMGGGEVARYVSAYGQDRVRSVVFAAAVPPFLLQSDDNPDGPLSEELYQQMRGGLEQDRDAFLDDFTTGFFSTAEGLQVTEEQRQQALALAKQSSQAAALGAMDAWATTDFRDDLGAISVPTLVIHGDGDQTVPFEGSGRRTHAAIDGSELHVVEGAPHGLNVSHAEEFNRALLGFLAE
ncbi:non-heme chloroperoxidase [Agrococcus sp. UYP10]|uniref:alpha/beta fold hydrolase n=1 Tax=Agrococcus sp. UYP10 TaxID=1756355 RepID=UPI00339331B4